MYQRLISPSKSKSFFLCGVRGSGKSTWLEQFFTNEKRANKILWFDLLQPELERELLLHPSRVIEQAALNPRIEWIIIDEVQKVPSLLDIVHLGITRHRLKFAGNHSFILYG